MKNISKESAAAALVIIFSILFFGNLPAQNSVIIKDGNTLITYKEHVSNSTEKVYMIETNTYATGTDLATLKGLNVPTEYWPLFANNECMIFSTEAVELQQENKRLQENLDNTREQRKDAESSLTTYKILFWLTLIMSIFITVALTVDLLGTKKKLRRERNAKS